jgi:hypothetical protein
MYYQKEILQSLHGKIFSGTIPNSDIDKILPKGRILSLFFKLIKQLFILFLNRNGTLGLAVKAGHYAVARTLDNAGITAPQLLHHLKTLVSQFINRGVADDLIVKFNRTFEIQAHVNQHQINGQPVDGFAQNALKIATSAVIKIIALNAVIDVGKWVQIAHFNLNRDGKLKMKRNRFGWHILK